MCFMKKIFLTGSTGYLGVHLVRELLANDECELFCLIRSDNEQAALEKLRSSLAKYELTLPDEYFERINCVCGDLEKDMLGIDQEKYDYLSAECDAVFHNAAWVNWLLPAELLSKVNNSGTKRALEFSSHNKEKRFYFVSSLSIFPFDGKDYTEHSQIDCEFELYGGYAQSKWLAEMVVQNEMKKGKDAVIFRPNLITGRTDDGIFSKSAFFENCLRSFIELGAAPILDNSFMAVVPVDYVSKGMAQVVFDENAPEKVYHFSNAGYAAMNDIVSWIRDMGYDIEMLELEQWKHKLFASRGFFENALYQFKPFVYGLRDGYMLMGKAYSAITDKYMNSKGIFCHPIDRELLDTYIKAFIRTGFLKAIPYEEDQ